MLCEHCKKTVTKEDAHDGYPNVHRYCYGLVIHQYGYGKIKELPKWITLTLSKPV